MQAGTWIACIFASIWGTVGLVAAGAPKPCLAAPLVVSLAIIAFSLRRRWPLAQIRSRNAWKTVATWSAVEGLAILLAVNVLARIDASQFAVPVIAIIVGLHFFPLARGIPLPIFHATGAALVALGFAGFPLPPAAGIPLVTFGAALTLWLTAIHMVSLGKSFQYVKESIEPLE